MAEAKKNLSGSNEQAKKRRAKARNVGARNQNAELKSLGKLKEFFK